MDSATFIETANQLLEHNKTQENLVNRVCGLLKESMSYVEEGEEEEWYFQAQTLFVDLHALQMYHESRRFNEDNFRKQFGYEPKARVADSINRINEPVDIPVLEPQDDHGEMSETELNKLFNGNREVKRHKQASSKRGLRQMSEREIASTSIDKLKELVADATIEEHAMDNSTDIYKIKARVANLARGPGMQLTPQGEQLCNTFVHVLKSLYDFADRVHEEKTRTSLIKLIRSHETMPSVLIAAAGAGVVQADKNQV